MRKKFIILAALLAMCGVQKESNAAGFALIEQSVSGMGTVYAGGAANYDDASSMYFNPAGLTYACGCQMVAGGHGVFPYAQFHNDDSILYPPVTATYNGTIPTGTTIDGLLPGTNGNDAGEPGLVGHTAIAKKLSDCVTVGITFNSPFGLVTDYDKAWVGRYHALRSQLLTLNINPSVGYKINECWRVGFGASAQYLHAKLSNAIDYGTVAWLQTLTLPAEQATAAQQGLKNIGFVPGNQGDQDSDGIVRLKGNSWGWGLNAGVIWEPCCGTRIGAQYRSEVKHKVSGEEKFEKLPFLVANPAEAGGLAGLFAGLQAAAGTNSRAYSHVTLPSTASISAYHAFNDCWAIMGDVTWTKWDVLKELVFTFKNENQPPSVTTLNWKNSWRYALGATYEPNSDLILRAGVAYDQSPIPNVESRTPRIPGQDRTWVGFGAGYNISCSMHIDVGYAHLFVSEPKIDKSGFHEAEDFTKGGLKGNYGARTDIVSGQLVYNF